MSEPDPVALAEARATKLLNLLVNAAVPLEAVRIMAERSDIEIPQRLMVEVLKYTEAIRAVVRAEARALPE